jgi:hypothetical protein
MIEQMRRSGRSPSCVDGNPQSLAGAIPPRCQLLADLSAVQHPQQQHYGASPVNVYNQVTIAAVAVRR